MICGQRLDVEDVQRGAADRAGAEGFAISAGSSTIGPREVLISKLVFRSIPSSVSPTRPLVRSESTR